MAGIDIQLKSVVLQSLVVRLRQTLGESAEFRNGSYWPNLSDANAPAESTVVGSERRHRRLSVF